MWRVLVGLLLMVLVSGSAIAQMLVDMHPSVGVSRGYITVGDVSEIKCTCDTDAVAKIALGSAPRIGYTRIVTRAEVQHKLQKKGFDVMFTGAEKTQIIRQGRNVSSVSLLEKAREALDAWLAEKKVVVSRIEAVSKLRDLAIPTGDYDIDFSIAPYSSGNIVRVWAEISVDGKHYQTYPVWFDVSARMRVYVLENDVNRGGRLEHSGKMMMTDLKSIGAEYVTENINSVRAKHALKVGNVLMKDDVEAIPAVEAGEIVNVHSKSGAVTIVTKGYAVNDGDVGEIVLLRSLTNAGEFAGKVTMNNTVLALGAE